MKLLEPNGLVDNLYKYVQTQIELTQIEVQERIEAAIKKLVLLLVLGIVSAMLCKVSTNVVLLSFFS